MDYPALLRKAMEARARAYAPYSRFAVGAAVLAESGSIYLGCNIENASYGLSSCAERTALFNAYAAGERRLTALAVAADTRDPVSPCGACRQVILELGGAELDVIMCNLQGEYTLKKAAELLPGAFSAEDISRG